MADEIEELEDDDSILASILGGLDDEVEEDEEEERLSEVEQKYAKRDEKTRKVVKTLAEKIAKDDAEAKVEKILTEFHADASEFAKDFLAIWRTGDETPAQMKKLVETARTREQEWLKKNAPSEDEIAAQEAEAEEKAEKIAREQWGTRPVGGSTESAEDRHERELQERNLRGDTRATAELILSHKTVAADNRNR